MVFGRSRYVEEPDRLRRPPAPLSPISFSTETSTQDIEDYLVFFAEHMATDEALAKAKALRVDGAACALPTRERYSTNWLSRGSGCIALFKGLDMAG